ncbi:MAG: hypothetical protein ACFE9D_01210 [Promethearchaeota archaeon]
MAIKASTVQLEHNIPNSKHLRIDDKVQFELILRKAIGEIFYVGHGIEAGLTIGSTLVCWDEITEIIEASPSGEHYFAACFSAPAAYTITSKIVVGFPTIIDADVAAFILTMCWSYFHIGEIPRTLVEDFINADGPEKILQPQKPLVAMAWTWSEGINIGWTPYLLYNPNALHIHYTAYDVYLMLQQDLRFLETLILLVISVILAIWISGPIGGVVGILIGGFFLGISRIRELDANPDGSIDQFIPVDLINFALGGGYNRYCRTPNWWWICFATYCTPLYPAPPI